MSSENGFSHQDPTFVVRLINTLFSRLTAQEIHVSKIPYLHMVCCRQSNSVQQWAGCWTGCRTGCWTGCRTGLRGNRFGLSVLHCNLLQYFCSTHFSITVHQAKGWGWPLMGSSLTSSSVYPALTTGSYSHNKVLSVETQISVYLIT